MSAYEVCDKLVDVEFDFDKDAIQTYVDGEWLRAKGTTLGADDGIGCAIELLCSTATTSSTDRWSAYSHATRRQASPVHGHEGWLYEGRYAHQPRL